MSDPKLKIAVIISRLAKYIITQVHTCREEKVMATGGDERKQTRTLLDLNFVDRRKFDEELDKND